MPRGDRTGPRGMGPMSGRGAGYCAGYDAPGFANPAAGGGYGMGYGRRGGGGFGRRNRFYATGVPGWAAYPGPPAWDYPAAPAPPQPSADQERDWLRARSDAMQQELEQINARLNELEQD